MSCEPISKRVVETAGGLLGSLTAVTLELLGAVGSLMELSQSQLHVVQMTSFEKR